MGCSVSASCWNPGVVIVGCGLIGNKRAKALGAAKLLACVDKNFSRAEALAKPSNAKACDDWRDAIGHKDVQIVIVSTTNDMLAEISTAAVLAGKHVLVEKPGARRQSELAPLRAALRGSSSLLRVGFNHRYHPALRKARELVLNQAVGQLMFIRGRYGHGGRLGYDQEWRSDERISGGGELIDQGVHLIDLSRMFLGRFPDVTGLAQTFYWKMPVDDNAFMVLRTEQKQVAFLHVSCTEWKNLFSLEIYGRTGKIHIEGLGGSYGVERITYYRMLPEMGPPETTTWEYPRGDDSWEMEFREFLEDIRLGREPDPGIEDASAALEVVEKIYGYPCFKA